MHIVAKWVFYPSIKTTTPGNFITTTPGKVMWWDDDCAPDFQETQYSDIPPNFPFDGASVPFPMRLTLATPFVLLGMTRGEMRDAASNHDKDYRRQTPKELADAIFGALLRARADEFEGFDRWRRRLGARLAEWAVRVGGHAAYEENGRKKNAAMADAAISAYFVENNPYHSDFDFHQNRLVKLENIYGEGFWRTAKKN